jgi:malonate decarboxylase beta subunit
MAATGERLSSPHLAQLGVPSSFDDGVAIGRATLAGRPVFIAAQEGEFMGGGVGEVHGAKLVGLLQRALRDRPDAVLLLAESGGVRLHEAKAGLIAVSEVMRALLDVRAAGSSGRRVDRRRQRLLRRHGDRGALRRPHRDERHRSPGDVGPEVIEASHGVDEFDSRDRALVWRTTGGKHRWLTGDCDALLEDDVAAFRAAAIESLSGAAAEVTLERLEAEHALLTERLDLLSDAVDGDDAVTLWSRLGVPDASRVTEMNVDEVRALRPV